MAKYPDIQVGDLWTADLASSMLPDVIRKTASTTRSSTTGALADPDLTVPVVANGIYIIEFWVKYATTTAAGFHTQWVVPSGTSGNRNVLIGLGATSGTTGAVDNTPSGTVFATHEGVHGFTTTVNYGSRNDVTLQVNLMEWAEVTVGSTAGNVAIGWGQAASVAVNTVVVSGSYAKAVRIG